MPRNDCHALLVHECKPPNLFLLLGAWIIPYTPQHARRAEHETLLIFNGNDGAAGSGHPGPASSHHGTEASWPRVFHCDLGEEGELPLLAQPRLGAEQVMHSKKVFVRGNGLN